MKSKSKEFIKKYHLNVSNVQSISYLTSIAELANFKVYRPKNSDDRIIKSLGLIQPFEEHFSLSYSHNGSNYIFIHASISKKFAASMILHEIAHIYLGHLNEFKIPTESDETEANMFVDSVLKAIYKNNKPNVASIIIAVVGIMSFLMSVNISNKYQNAIEPVSGTYLSESTYMQTENESVFVTKNGTKYHKADCYHIKDSDVIELTVSEAEEAGYEACKDCF